MHSQSSQGLKERQETTTLTTANLPPHSHSVGMSSFAGTVSLAERSFLDFSNANIEIEGRSSLQTPTSSTGNGEAVGNQQPTLRMKHIIALVGLYPSRGRMLEAQDNFNSTKTSEKVQERKLFSSEPFIGEITLFAGNFAPRGWAFCEGQFLPIAQNTALFSILGTTFGGNGRTDFGLPNFNDRVVVGAGLGPGLVNRPLGSTGGSSETFVSVSNVAAHSHGLALTNDLTASLEERVVES